MKGIITLFLVVASYFTLNAQTDVVLRINHKLDDATFQLDVESQNNLAHIFKATRLQYYITRITVVHDGGQELAITDDTVALITAGVDAYSDVPLGNLNVTNIESVKFHIGVYAPMNTSDPLQHPSDHPLAPQAPSMHWGWAAGYRFLVYEGYGGHNFSQMFQLHGLGDDNYFETEIVATGQSYLGAQYIAIDGNYEEGLYGIDLTSGVIAHGVDLQDLEALINFRDRVFTASVGSVGVDEISEVNWNVYPNPSNQSEIFIQYPESLNDMDATVSDSRGRVIASFALANQSQMNISESGIYFVQLKKAGVVLGMKKVVVY